MRRILVFVLALGGCDCGSSADPCMVAADCALGELCIDNTCTPQVDGGDEDARALPDGGRFDVPGDVPGLDGSMSSDADTGVCATATGTPGRVPVDIIVIVDQSASTGEEAAGIQANINTNLGDVLESSGLDYRVILINSATGALCPEPPLGNGVDCGDNPPSYYRVAHPVNNSDALTLLLWTYDGFGKRPNSCHRTGTGERAWRDWIRFDSLKVFIVFSDDDPTTFSRTGLPPACPGRPSPTYSGCTNADCLSTTGTSFECSSFCPNFGCPTFADRPADWGGGDFPTELYALEPRMMVDGRMENPFGSAENPRWVFHSLIGVQRLLEPAEPLTDRCAICNSGGNTAENAGVTYQRLSRLTGGVRFPSCNTDYSPVFGRISSDLTPIACELTLEETGLGTVDTARTNVLYYPGGADPAETIPRDDAAACDAGANGWQLTGGGTRIRICGDACDRIQADPDARLEIEIGCEVVETDGGVGDGGMPGDGGPCVPEDCTNDIDDDCDGLIDYQDRDCVLF